MTLSFTKILAAALIAAAIAPAITLRAAEPGAEPVITAPAAALVDSLISVSFDLSLEGVKVGREERLTLIPVIADSEGNSMQLPAVVVAGHNRRIRDERQGRDLPSDILANPGDTIAYSAIIPLRPWMNNSTISIAADVCGCGATSVEAVTTPVGTIDFAPREFVPSFIYLRPEGETTKMRNIKGSAYIDFRVNRTEINPSYRRNPEELAKIVASIDSIRTDKDITIKAITIHGYASPEGSYANNTRLAKGRTEALAKYVESQYSFPAGTIYTASTPEDWRGLIAALEANDSLPDRDAILAIARSDEEPDLRDRRIRTEYPSDYAWLLENVYPALRHSDYSVDYQIRAFTDPAEIRQVALTAPQKLSLGEFYAAADGLEAGTPEFDRLWAIALSVYPASEAANLNAANAAMASGHLNRAAECLARAGEGSDAVYARGVLAALEGNYADARTLFLRARDMGVDQATAALDEVEKASTPAGLTPKETSTKISIKK